MFAMIEKVANPVDERSSCCILIRKMPDRRTLGCNGPRPSFTPLSNIMPLVVVGKVKSTKDPQGLGRVQVELQGYEKRVDIPWIRIAGSYASAGNGAVLLPEKDDEVLVLKGDGENSEQMMCLGSVYNGKRKPPSDNADGENNVKQLKTRAGNTVTIVDKSGEESISIATPNNTLHIQLDQKSGQITITGKDKVVVSCPSGEVSVECQNAKVSASAEVKISGGASVSVEAAQISLAGNVSIG